MTGWFVRVVIPVHDEEQLLGRCLDSVAAAAATASTEGHDVRIVVVLDDCTDRSAGIARSRLGVDVLETDSGLVGESRSRGCESAIHEAEGHGIPLERVWLASTDADSVVPPEWIVRQLVLAGAGSQLVLGTVHPDPDEMTPALARLWASRQRLEDGHPHIHGANLGVRGDAYVAAGGYAALAVHEDVDLVERVRRLGVAESATAGNSVLTSARLEGRTPGGFSGYLRDLVESADPGGLPA
ncbi:MAG: glycosyltransferase family 2 protein [Micrococcales bacterium]|nr:glycosyltransferase family 2 protein [Micrococcales bacterium]